MPDMATGLAAASLGTGIIGGIKGSNDASSANKNAVAAQQESARQQLDFLERMYNQSRADFTPYRDLGSFAASRLQQRLGMPSGYGNTVSGLSDVDTLYNTSRGTVRVPSGSTMFQNSGGTLVGAKNPQGGWADLTGASPYTPPDTSNTTKIMTADDLMEKYGIARETPVTAMDYSTSMEFMKKYGWGWQYQDNYQGGGK